MQIRSDTHKMSYFLFSLALRKSEWTSGRGADIGKWKEQLHSIYADIQLQIAHILSTVNIWFAM